MADEGVKDPGATFYDVRTLNKWFLISVAALTLSYVWSVKADHDRDWKQFQRDFSEFERVNAVKQGQVAFAAAGGSKVLTAVDKEGREVPSALDLEIERLRGVVASDHQKRPELEAELKKWEYEFSIANADMKKAKANFEAERFVYEEHAHFAGEHDAFNPQQEEVREAYAKFLELKKEYEKKDEESKAAEAARDEAKAALESFEALASDQAAKLALAELDVGRLEKRADSVDRDRWFNKFRNSYFFNFMAPSESPRKIVVDEIHDDLNFLKIPKVDMCTTCHLATDRNKDYPPGTAHVTYGGEKNPFLDIEEDGEVVARDSAAFRSHSSPELFCTSLSPHPQDRFGCSGCHQGGNQRLTFPMTFHTPTDMAERELWEKEHHWHPVHEWEYPMFGSQYLEASCYKCHRNEVHIEGAAKWNHGRDLVAKLGCFGCHKMAPFDGERKVGPPLGHVVSKFANLDFMLKWVDNPQSFRPSTRMPAFFHRENREKEIGRDQAEVTALVAYLYNLTTPQELKKYPGNGDAASGKKIVGETGGIGCLGCHSVDDFQAEKLPDLRHGPDLSGIGSKVTPDWLFTWILDPKSLWPDRPGMPGTNMPNLRLTEQQAADVVAYLMTKRNVTFEQLTFEKPADDTIYDAILEEKLTERMTSTRAKSEIAAMSGLEKRRRSGEFLLNHYGCFGCHDVPGYEDAKPIGTELNGWGSKHADRLDFGMVEMDWKALGFFNRETWLKQKLSNTRFYDRNKDKKPFEKLKMPQFSQFAGPDVVQRGPGNGHDEAHAAEHAALPADLNAGEREAVMTFILSLTKDNTASSIEKQLTPAEAAVERGRRIARDKNCIGCHVLYGEGGEIRQFLDAEAKAKNDPDNPDGRAFYPPILDGQGARTQPNWLFSFLKDPSQGAGRGSKNHLRPWLKARMPTFDFTQEELNDLVAYFGNEEVWHTSVDRELWDSIAAKFRADFPGYDERTLRTADANRQQAYQALVARIYRRQNGRFLHETDFPYLEPLREGTASELEKGRQMFEDLKCVLCHMPGGQPPPGKTEADMAPDLTLARNRLAPTWVKHWFGDPADYQPGTRMPSFWAVDNGVRATVDPKGLNNAEEEMRLIRDYLFSSRFASDYPEVAKRAGQ